MGAFAVRIIHLDECSSGFVVAPSCHSGVVAETSLFEQLDRINDELAKLCAGFDAGLLTGRQAARVVCAAADIELFALTLKTLAMRRWTRA